MRSSASAWPEEAARRSAVNVSGRAYAPKLEAAKLDRVRSLVELVRQARRPEHTVHQRIGPVPALGVVRPAGGRAPVLYWRLSEKVRKLRINLFRFFLRRDISTP